MSPPSLGEGSEIGGYRIESLLGRGGMGSVYLARHLRLGRLAALKVLRAEFAEDGEFRERFMRESQIAASLDHPNIVPIYDADEHHGVLYIAMRYVEGSDLGEQLGRKKTLSPELVLGIVEQIGGALDSAHERGLVHRDVKPSNILIAAPGYRAYLSDFGVAKRTSSRGLTKTGHFIGTVDYCPPEQIEGREVDGRADVYALGCVLYHCLTGQPPFIRDTDVAVIHAHLLESPPALTTVRPDLPSALDGVVATAMAKYPEVRYATCALLSRGVRDALRQGLEGADTAPLPASERAPRESLPATLVDAQGRLPPVQFEPPTERASPGSRKRRLWLGAAGALLLLALAGTVAAYLMFRGNAESASTTPPPTTGATTNGGHIPLLQEPLGTLSRSAARIGTALEETIHPFHLTGLHEAAAQEHARVGRARLRVGRLVLSGDAGVVRARLVEAAASHQRYLGLVARATATTQPARGGLEILDAARGPLQKALSRYRQVFRLEPELEDTISGSGLDNLTPARSAMQVEIERIPPSDFSTRRCTAAYGPVGVPNVFVGKFTACDRRERCSVNNYAVVCSAGPSGKAVRLTIGDGAGHGEYLGTQGSTDSGGASMPEGTWFRTPRRTILCSSSRRGITCLDLLRSYEGFTIGDYRVGLERGGSTVGTH